MGKGRVVLTKDGLRKYIQLKKNAVVIDGKKHKTSVLTTQFLPDYPSKDETSWPSGINAEEGNFTLRVCVHTTEKEADFVSYIRGLKVQKHYPNAVPSTFLFYMLLRLQRAACHLYVHPRRCLGLWANWTFSPI